MYMFTIGLIHSRGAVCVSFSYATCGTARVPRPFRERRTDSRSEILQSQSPSPTLGEDRAPAGVAHDPSLALRALIKTLPTNLTLTPSRSG